MKDSIIIKTSEEGYLEKALKYIKDTLIDRNNDYANDFIKHSIVIFSSRSARFCTNLYGGF